MFVVIHPVTDTHYVNFLFRDEGSHVFFHWFRSQTQGTRLIRGRGTLSTSEIEWDGSLAIELEEVLHSTSSEVSLFP